MTTKHLLVPFQSDQILEGVARQVTADINQTFSKERLERAAASNERVRLARELHDGLLQSLTAAALQLDALSRVIDNNPTGASKRLRDIEDMIAEEQHDLRRWIETLRPASSPSMVPNGEMTAAIEKLCCRIEQQSELRIRFSSISRGMIPRNLADEVYRLIQEALSNIARHACAHNGRVSLEVTGPRVRIVVEDDGRGFPYHGSYDLSSLKKTRRGPASLMERVASLAGDLTLTSTPAGSRLDIGLPVGHRSVADKLSP